HEPEAARAAARHLRGLTRKGKRAMAEKKTSKTSALGPRTGKGAKRSPGAYVQEVTQEAQSHLRLLKSENEALPAAPAAVSTERDRVSEQMGTERELIQRAEQQRSDARVRATQAELDGLIRALNQQIAGYQKQERSLSEQLERLGDENRK